MVETKGILDFFFLKFVSNEVEGLGRISVTPESNGAWGWLGLEKHGREK